MATPLCLSSPPRPPLPLFIQTHPRTSSKTSTVVSLSCCRGKGALLLKSPQTSKTCPPRHVVASSSAKDSLPSPDQIVSIADGNDGVNTVVSGLLLIAFIGLSVLTIGVIYIGVTDFLQKRERERFEKEEAAKKKKAGKKGKIRTRARVGPKGFGQKTDDEDNEVDD